MASESDTETSVHTELSAGDAYRDAYEPFRVAGDKPEVHGFRRWWLNNPLNNLWAKKPNQWQTFKKVASGVDPAEAVKGGANINLEDITKHGPTTQEILADGSFELHELPSDEAWFGTPDPDVYAPGTNNLSKQQLADEVSKGNVVTLRQLKQHLASASEADLKLWHQVLMMQRLREREFVDLPDGGRVSVWDLYNYVKNNPELKALADKDPNLVVPVEGMTREERIAALAEVAPWKLCGNERHMVLPPDVADKLSWGLLAGGSWYSRRPTRWLKGLDGVKDFDYGLYVHEDAAQQLMGDTWGGRAPGPTLADRAFYREALGLAPAMGMSLLAVASRPLPLEEVTQAWEQRMKQQIDRLNPPSSSDTQPKILLSTSSSAASGAASGSGSGSGTASSEEESSSSSSEAVVQSSRVAAAPPAPAPPAARPAPAAAARPATPAAAAAASSPAAAQPQAVHAAQQPSKPSSNPAAAAAAATSTLQAAAQQPVLQQQQQQHLSERAPVAVAAPVHEVEERYLGLAQLTSLFDRERLAADTQLLDMRGVKLRQGSTIIFTAHPSGSLLVQAISPGLVKEQRSYILGSVFDHQLSQALMSMFLDPDHTLDPDFTAAAGIQLLGVVNGLRTGKLQQRSSASPLLHGDVEQRNRLLVKHARWGLPDVGKAPQQLPLVKGVRREVMYQQIEQAFESALRAAAAVEVPADTDASDVDGRRRVVYARRQAAEAELKQRLGSLGLDVSGLTLPQPDMPSDLLSLARPLASAAVAGAGR